MHMTSTELDIKTLEGWLWDAACKIRGEIDAPKAQSKKSVIF